MYEILSNFNMLMLVIGTLPSILAVIKNRTNLSAYSLLGSAGIFIGQLGYILYFYLIETPIATLLGLVPTAFWAIVLGYKLKQYWKRKYHKK